MINLSNAGNVYDPVYAVDKSFAEIKSAVERGALVSLRTWENDLSTSMHNTDTAVYFCIPVVTSTPGLSVTQYTISSDDSVECTRYATK